MQEDEVPEEVLRMLPDSYVLFYLLQVRGLQQQAASTTTLADLIQIHFYCPLLRIVLVHCIFVH